MSNGSSPPSAFRPRGSEIGALVCGLLPFVVSVGWNQTTTINGVTTTSGFNLAGFVLGCVAVVLAWRSYATLDERNDDGPPVLHLAWIVVAGLVGLFQVVRSFGFV